MHQKLLSQAYDLMDYFAGTYISKEIENDLILKDYASLKQHVDEANQVIFITEATPSPDPDIDPYGGDGPDD